MLVELLQGRLLWRESRAPGKRASGSDDEAKTTAHRMKLRALSDPDTLFACGRCPGQAHKFWPRTAPISASRPRAAAHFVRILANAAGWCIHGCSMELQDEQISTVMSPAPCNLSLATMPAQPCQVR
jgi:hypothetical protein